MGDFAVDVLSDVLATAQLSSLVLGRLDLRAPWGICMRDQPHSVFHVVVEGSCWLEIDGGPPSQAQKGDVLVMPRGRGHELRDDRLRKVTPVELNGRERPALAQGDGGTQLVCGMFRFEDRHKSLLLSTLPEVVHVHELAEEVRPWLEQTLALIDRETREPGPGSRAALGGLCDALFIYVLRNQLKRAPEGWLGALRDEHIGQALRLIHGDPGRDWTVAELAGRVAMSRSAFAMRFTENVGQPPLAYLIAWRAQKAASLLRSTRRSIAEIAGLVGYDSEAAFNKAFKRAIGVTPGAYRGRASDKSSGRSDMEGASRAP